MLNFLLIASYVIFAVAGSTLIKYGGLEKFSTLFKVPFTEIGISWVTLFGIIAYGVSFVLYTILLNKFDLSFISPLTVSLVYILLMVTAVIIFKEPMNSYKVIGCIVVLVGILLIHDRPAGFPAEAGADRHIHR